MGIERRFFGGGGGASGVAGAAVRVTPEQHGAVADCRTVTDAAITESDTTLTSTFAEFTQADVGKYVQVAGAGLNIHANVLVSTIVSVTNATTVELATAAAVTVSGARMAIGTDDTAAIQAAIDQAVADGIANDSFYAEVVFSASEYVVAAAPQVGAPYYGNAQLRLPVMPETGRKFTLVLRGCGEAATFGHWLQDMPQRSGTIIRSMLIGGANHGTWGPPACIGGPTRADSGGGFPAGFSNMLLVVDGLLVLGPRDPSFTAVYAARLGQLHVKSLGALADRTPAEMNVSRPQNDLGLGLAVPRFSNNHYVYIENFACEGFYYGTTLSDHTTILRGVLVYCRIATFLLTGGANEHGISILNLGVESCDTVLQAIGSEGGRVPIQIHQVNTEIGAGVTFIDTNNVLVGEICWTSNDASSPTVTGCENVRIIDLNRRPGAATAPAVPATTVALRNPFWRDAAVTVSGGTVTAIAVDGVAQGVTSGPVIVPTGQTITLTYSDAPTWVWTLL